MKLECSFVRHHVEAKLHEVYLVNCDPAEPSHDHKEPRGISSQPRS